MTSRTHEAGAVALMLAGVAFIPIGAVTPATGIAALFANLIGSLLPDIDQASNRLWDMVPGGNLVGRGLRRLFLGHRTLTHSVLGIIIIYKLINWGLPQLFNQSVINTQILIYSLMAGFLSHLALDLITEDGLPLLFPIKWKFGIPPFKILRIKTGGWVEKWIVFPILILLIGWMVIRKWQG
jgi:inner membrane protein